VSGTAVTQWNDKSGNAGHATQTNSGNRPTFTGSGVVFNAASSQCLNMNTTFASTHSLYIVATPTSATGVYLFGRTYPSSHPSFIINYTGTALEYYAGGDGTTRTTLASPTSTFVAGYVRTFGTGVVARYNGTNIPIGGAPTTENSSIAWGSLGCSAPAYGNFYTGTIYELIIYNTTLSTIQCQKIESYLTQKWGLVGSLPSNHPGIISRIYPSVVKQTISPQLYYTAFNPTQIAGCVLWLDAADSTTITIATGVSQLNDKSTNAYNLTQATTGLQPSYSGNLITFSSNKYLNIPQAAINNTATYSLFMIFNPIASTNWILQKQYNGVSSRTMLSMTRYWQNNTGTTNYLYWTAHANSGAIANSATALSTSTLQLIELVYDGSTLTMYRNGNVLSTTSSASYGIGNETNATNFTIGSWIADGSIMDSGVTNFQFGELIFYTTSLTAAQRQQVEAYLGWKWGLLGNLPPGNPYLTNNISYNPFPSTTPAFTVIVISVLPAEYPDNVSSVTVGDCVVDE
jgi:hypothetical protein